MVRLPTVRKTPARWEMEAGLVEGGMGSRGYSRVGPQTTHWSVFEPESLKLMKMLRTVFFSWVFPVLHSLGTSVNEHQMFAGDRIRKVQFTRVHVKR